MPTIAMVLTLAAIAYIKARRVQYYVYPVILRTMNLVCNLHAYHWV